MTIISVFTLLTGCGSKKDESSASLPQEATENEENTEAQFGAQVLADNPLSEEYKEKLAGLNSNYSKVNWDIAYAAPNCDGIVISESKFQTETGCNFLAVAFTNLRDEAVVLNVEGYAENTAGDVVADVVDNNVELGPNVTVAKAYVFKYDEPSGEIRWNNISSSESSHEYIPYDFTYKFEKAPDGYYGLDADVVSDEHLRSNTKGMAFVLNKEGKFIYCAEESNLFDDIVYFYKETFGGENADVVYFKNYYK